MPMPINRPQNGLNPGARPLPAAPTQPIRPGLNPQHVAPAVAGGGENARPVIAPPQPGNTIGGYAGRMNQAPAVAGMGETPITRPDVMPPRGIGG